LWRLALCEMGYDTFSIFGTTFVTNYHPRSAHGASAPDRPAPKGV